MEDYIEEEIAIDTLGATGDELINVEIKNIHYLTIEAADLNAAFSVFKRKLEEREIFVSQFDDISAMITEEDRHKDSIANKFIQSTKYIKEPIVWGGLYADAKGNTLIKKFVEKNVTQNGTKKWETRYVLIGDRTGKRIDVTQTTKGDAVNLAKDLVEKYKENISIQVEKVLTSHDPTVSTIEYIKDKTEHDRIFMFMCNTVTFDEEGFNALYEENVELDPDTKQYKIKVETTFEYNKKIIL